MHASITPYSHSETDILRHSYSSLIVHTHTPLRIHVTPHTSLFFAPSLPHSLSSFSFPSSLISLPSPSASIFPSSPISPSSSLSPFSFLSYIYQSLNYAACRTQQSSHLLENLVHEHFEGLRYVRTERGIKREKRKRKLIIDVLYFQIVEINSRILT